MADKTPPLPPGATLVPQLPPGATLEAPAAPEGRTAPGTTIEDTEALLQVPVRQGAPKQPERIGKLFEPRHIGTAMGLMKGLADPFAGAAQLVGFNAPAQALQQFGEKAKEFGPTGAAEFVGNVLSPLPIKGGKMLEEAVGALPKVGQSVMARMGAQGAVQGALMPTEVTPDMSYADMLAQKGEQALKGAGFGAVAGKGTQMLLDPRVSQKLQMLKDMGMTRFTPGQLMSDIPGIGRGIQKMESELTSLPLSGSIIQAAQKGTAEQFNRAVGNMVLEPINQKVPKWVEPGNELMGYLSDKVNNVYRGLENRITFSNAVDKSGRSATDRLIDRYTQVARDKPIEHQRLILDELKNSLLDNLQLKKQLSGEEFRIAEKALGGKAQSYARDPAKQDVGFALRELQDALRGELTRQNPKVGAELSAAHEMFKRYLRAERAAAYRGAEEGVFNPQQFRAAVETLAGRRGTATGRGMMMPEAQAASSVLGKIQPDSGTAGRLMTPAAIGKTLGFGAAEGGANLATMGAPLAITGMLYNPISMYLMTKMATSRPSALQQLSPAVEPVAARGAAALGNQ